MFLLHPLYHYDFKITLVLIIHNLFENVQNKYINDEIIHLVLIISLSFLHKKAAMISVPITALYIVYLSTLPFSFSS